MRGPPGEQHIEGKALSGSAEQERQALEVGEGVQDRAEDESKWPANIQIDGAFPVWVWLKLQLPPKLTKSTR